MGLLDWLTDGSLGTGSPADTGMPQAGMPAGAPPAPPMPPVQPTGADAPPPAPPPPTPDPTPAAGPPDPPIAPTAPPPQSQVPLPVPRPPGADAPPPVPPPAPGPATPPPVPPPPPAAPGAPLSLAPTAPGPSATPYKLGDQTALGRALGVDPKSQAFSTTMAGIGSGLTAAGNSKGKSPFQALTSGAGATLEGSAKEQHAANKDAQSYLTAAINAKKAGDDATYKTNYTAYLAAKLKSEQDATASKDKATANKNDSPTQLYLSAQRNVAADPLVKGAMTAYQAAIKDGDPTKVATTKAAYEQTVQERQAAHLAGVGLHPQTAADIAKQPGMSQANPINGKAAGITPENITSKLQVGQYYTNPSNGQLFIYKGEPSKTTTSKSDTPAASKPEPANPLKPDKVPASASAEDDD